MVKVFFLKVHIYWEGHKILLYVLLSKVKGRFRKILWPSQNIWTLIQGKYYNDNNPFYCRICRFGHVLMAFLGLDSSVCIVSLFDDKQSLYFIHLAEIISWVHVQTFESMHLLKSPYKRRCHFGSHFVLTCF